MPEPESDYLFDFDFEKSGQSMSSKDDTFTLLELKL